MVFPDDCVSHSGTAPEGRTRKSIIALDKEGFRARRGACDWAALCADPLAAPGMARESPTEIRSYSYFGRSVMSLGSMASLALATMSSGVLTSSATTFWIVMPSVGD